MEKKIIDAKGLPCPKPVILTKEALENISVGDELSIIMDSETSKENVVRFLRAKNASVGISESNGIYTVIAKKTTRLQSEPEPEITCSTAKPQKSPVICFKGDKMGTGDNELGEVLIRSFINIIEEITPLPQSIIFYNSGVFLALKNSPVVESLKKLEQKGIPILVCGTCLNHFKQKENLGAGIVSNMYDIAATMAKASSLIYP
jgi:selenium metabolism protein YedF